MDRRPIGVFDSGLGGLTAVRELARLMPEEDLIYFGDTGRVPYGGRSQDTITTYARQDVRFLRSFDPKAIVIACGTVSTIALDVLRRENDIPVFGVVGPAVRAAARLAKDGPVGLIGTKATIRSGAYERLGGMPAVRPVGGERAIPPRRSGDRDSGCRVSGAHERGGGGHSHSGLYPLPPASAGYRRLYGAPGVSGGCRGAMRPLCSRPAGPGRLTY